MSILLRRAAPRCCGVGGSLHVGVVIFPHPSIAPWWGGRLLCVSNYLAAPEAGFEEFEEARPTLFSLARTCRAFSEASLDRLGHTFGGLEPLIQCYATESTEERGIGLQPS